MYQSMFLFSKNTVNKLVNLKLVKSLKIWRVFGATTAISATVLVGIVKSRYCQAQSQSPCLEETIEKTRDLIMRVKDERCVPGIVVAVSKDGKLLWNEGFGYADVENRSPCHPDSVMRVASISKSITMAMVARLWELGKLDLDAPVQAYVKEFPEKTVNGKKVRITTRHLLSHLSGIRHYTLPVVPAKDKPSKDTNYEDEKSQVCGTDKNTADKITKGNTGDGRMKEKHPADFSKGNTKTTTYESGEDPEMYSNETYNTVTEAVDIFKDDPLCHEPGTKYLYSTYAWTLVSLIAERVSGVEFTRLLTGLFTDLGLTHTYVDRNRPLIYHRARQYEIEKGKLANAPSVDCSNKWAGGGLLSTAGDLVKFGNAMLYSYQYTLCGCHTDSCQNEVQVNSSSGGGARNTEVKGRGIARSDSSDGGSNERNTSNCRRGADSDGSNSLVGRLGKGSKISRSSGINSDGKSGKDIDENSVMGGMGGEYYSGMNTCCGKDCCNSKPGYLKPETMRELWLPVVKVGRDSGSMYGLGWEVMPDVAQYGMCREEQFHAYHTGGAVGGCSVLVVAPSGCGEAVGHARVSAGDVRHAAVTSQASRDVTQSDSDTLAERRDGERLSARDITRGHVGDVTDIPGSSGQVHEGMKVGEIESCEGSPPCTVDCRRAQPPTGVVVAIITNSSGVRLLKTAVEIAKLFENVKI